MIMSRLADLYKAIETMRREHLSRVIVTGTLVHSLGLVNLSI